MSVYDDNDLWKLMEAKATEDGLHEYVTGVRQICDFGVARAKTIRDTFPRYTLHDEDHIRNVLRLMIELLGNKVNDLERDEAATLVICACCHDVGMSYEEREKRELLEDDGRIRAYLDQHPKDYVQAYAKNPDRPILDDEALQRSFFRSIHHERVLDLLSTFEWPEALVGQVDQDVIVRVCQSHGCGIATLDGLDSTDTIDLRMCAVLLRLADILDFDDSRAPEALYEYCDFATHTDEESKVSAQEWQKHRSSKGFRFPPVKKRKHAYNLTYIASCKHPQVEQAVRGYLDWVDKELRECRDTLEKYVGRWHDLVLPQKVKRNIKSIGYESGQYRLSLDQDKVLDLLVGNDLYEDQSVFVRELIQNAIDAVRTREELDGNRPADWEPCIRIRTWTDDEGYNWFRIEDNGVGMTKQIMLNHLLKVGSSYYTSDDFRREKLLHHASSGYTPISRFGIGILSCFMDGNGATQVEISTRHYEQEAESFRLRIDDTSGFYRLCKKSSGHHPGPMHGVTDAEQREYMLCPGTAIAVRTNLHASGAYDGFKEIVDKYVAFPPVAIHYEGPEGSFDYPTEQELVALACGVNSDGAGSGDSSKGNVIDLPIPADAVEQIQSVWPEFCWPEDFKVQLGRLALGAYAASPHVSGAAVVARTVGHFPTFVHRFGTHEIEMRARIDLEPVAANDELDHTIRLRVQIEPMDERLDTVLIEYNEFMYSDNMGDLVRQHAEDGDSCLDDMLGALRSHSTLESKWRNTMRERFGLSEEELDKELERARGVIGMRMGVKPEEIDLALALSRTREWRFSVCDLSTFDWFKPFVSARERTGHKMLVAHNGIACGSAEGLFCDRQGRSHCVAAILLLKDKYRPDLGLARDGIRGFTLETQLVLELMRRRIQADGFYLGEDCPTHPADHRLLAAAAYEDVLANNKKLAHDLTLDVQDERDARIDDLVRAGSEHGLVVPHSPLLMWDDHSGVLAQRYQRFCWAHAQRVFAIKADFSKSFSLGQWRGEAQLYPKELGDLPEGYHLFPPAFFALPLSPEDTCLTESVAAQRHWINATHPLAKFLLKNATTLQDRTPGILAKFTRCLAEDDGEELVKKVNALLDRLRALHNVPLSVPAELKLTVADLL